MLTAVGVAIIAGGLALCRRQPRAAWMVAVVGLLVLAPDGESDIAILLVGVHAFCAGRWDGRWSGIVGVAALVAALELGVALDHESAVPGLILPLGAWAAGRALGDRAHVADQLAERLRELDEEREAHAALSVRYERARIASDLHDIVAHAISVMVVQASAGQRLAPHDPEATAETFAVIAGAAHQAERDMGRLVTLLGDEAAIGPAPDLALVDELVARAAGSGLAVTLRLEGEREGLPADVAEAAYRTVQEGLTNALRYAAGGAVQALVRGEGETLLVEIRNAPGPNEPVLAGAGTGTGLQGLRERVAACGGTLDAGPTTDGGWCLAARLPRR